MDKKNLAEEVRKVITSFENEGKEFKFVALVPTYRWDSQTDYILQILTDWVPDSTYPGFNLIIERLYKLLDKKHIHYINRLNLYTEHGDVQALPGDPILVNNIDYHPEMALWRQMQSAAHG